ncbi:hypothetical protein BCR34DRAFT_582904 [Clohesyomyces aquaticus]|uniref:Uncharacterized protein n=1 Tax=Clohesyomyces aquaticus TaxID=1231657 RepID=A0A1Y2A7X7_9PLEO|nr:hypothetical protein BCR34DRAFT_582904 [Clohesyomyces aquaticus]
MSSPVPTGMPALHSSAQTTSIPIYNSFPYSRKAKCLSLPHAILSHAVILPRLSDDGVAVRSGAHVDMQVRCDHCYTSLFAHCFTVKLPPLRVYIVSVPEQVCVSKLEYPAVVASRRRWFRQELRVSSLIPDAHERLDIGCGSEATSQQIDRHNGC